MADEQSPFETNSRDVKAPEQKTEKSQGATFEETELDAPPQFEERAKASRVESFENRRRNNQRLGLPPSYDEALNAPIPQRPPPKPRSPTGYQASAASLAAILNTGSSSTQASGSSRRMKSESTIFDEGGRKGAGAGGSWHMGKGSNDTGVSSSRWSVWGSPLGDASKSRKSRWW
jgi:hypothetical protein